MLSTNSTPRLALEESHYWTFPAFTRREIKRRRQCPLESAFDDTFQTSTSQSVASQIIQTQLDLFFITDELITFRINIIQSQTYMYLSVRGQIHFIYFNAVKVNTLWKAADVKITGIKSDTWRRFGNKTNYQEQFKLSELSGILCFCNTFAILLQHFAVLKGNDNCVVFISFRLFNTFFN